MSNLDPAFWTAIRTLLVATYPEVAANYSVSQFNRVNWSNLLDFGGASQPYVLFELGDYKDDPEGPMDATCYRYPLTMYYVFANANEDDCQAFAAEKGNLWRDALIRYNGTAFQQIPPWPTVNVNWDNPANANFYDANVPLFAAMVHAELIVGEVIEL
jgi:hypothetical protein